MSPESTNNLPKRLGNSPVSPVPSDASSMAKVAEETRQLGASLGLQLSAMGLSPASGKQNERRLASGIRVLDTFLGGGLPIGAVSEWGAPLGSGGREVLLAWLARLTQGDDGRLKGQGTPAVGGDSSRPAAWGLWVHSRPQLSVYPPAWEARGVRLAQMRFACSLQPLADLRPAFLDPFFRIIVLDGPRHFSPEDCAFVARQARANNQVVVVLRDAWLGPRLGNIWARLRLNCAYDQAGRNYRAEIVRGMSPKQLLIAESLVQTALSTNAGYGALAPALPQSFSQCISGTTALATSAVMEGLYARS